MITLKEWMEIVDYRITEGSDYYNSRYGDKIYSLDSWNGEQEGYSFTIIFDTLTQKVYEVQAHDCLQKDLLLQSEKIQKHGTISTMLIWNRKMTLFRRQLRLRMVKTMIQEL